MSAGKVAMCFLGQASTSHRDQDVGASGHLTHSSSLSFCQSEAF